MDLLTVARMVTTYGLEDMPWQLSGESLAQTNPPNRAYRLGEAAAIISNPAADKISLRALVTSVQSGSEKHSLRLLQALFAHFPGRIWIVPAIWPEEAGAILEEAGFKDGEFSQFQMRLDLPVESSSQ